MDRLLFWVIMAVVAVVGYHLAFVGMHGLMAQMTGRMDQLLTVPSGAIPSPGG